MYSSNKDYCTEELVQEFVNGDIKAFDYLYSIFCTRLKNFVFSLIKIESESEELVQEIFVKVWESRETVKKFGSFNSFLFTIAHNTTISYLRKKASNTKYVEYIKSIQTEGEEPMLDEKLDLEKFKLHLETVISAMPKKQREVFKLKHWEDYTYRQIAEELNISVKTVENHLANARRFLKEKLGPQYVTMLLFATLFS